MRKISIALFTLIGLLIFAGCASMTSTSYFDTLYEIKDVTTTDIHGTTTARTMLIDRAMSLSGNESTKIMSVAGGYGLVVEGEWTNWRFVDSVSLRTDARVSEMVITIPPQRKVLSGGAVSEALFSVIPQETVDAMKTTTTLALQYKGRFVELPEEAVAAVKEFLQ
jgi:hypothetical protein